MKKTLDSKTAIREGLEEYYYEKFGRIEEEREAEQRYEKLMNEYENLANAQRAKRQALLTKAIKKYMTKHPHDICQKCYRECTLITSHDNACGYVGLRVINEEGKLKMKNIPKGTWDEIFIPLSDEEIKKTIAIY